MSTWELYTWLAVTILIVGPVLVAVRSLRDLADMWRSVRRRDN